MFAETNKEKIMLGVMVGEKDLGGKNPADARALIEEEIERLQNGVPVHFSDHVAQVPSSTLILDPDLPSLETVTFDSDETLRRAWAIGRNGNWVFNTIDQLRGVFAKRSIDIALSADTDNLKTSLENDFAAYIHPAQNASVIFKDDMPSIIPETEGQRLNFDAVVKQVVTQLQKGNLKDVYLVASQEYPELTARDAEQLLPLIPDFIDLPKTELWYEKNKWVLDTDNVKEWLGFSKVQGKASLVLDPEKIKIFLEKEVVPKVNREAEDARLSIEGSRVSVWQAGQDGLELNMEETANLIAQWPEQKPEKIEIVVDTVASAATDATADELGLKEIIGTGTSKFAGSPANRRHNIKTGANALHGLLIKPGEEFSLLKALGEIDGRNGYLQELVIKEGKTIPEYGGGLCQIGTTMFRATFNSGLPVTQRKNHSYRVVYYEPAGTDATIYDPAPDYRFLNDTGHYVLIQARMGTNELSFDFWGTKDERKVEVSKPVIYNIKSPPPTKIIETTDLPEGKKRCTESAHAGADAYFDYKVTYANGEIKEKRFTSHYVPWQAVCLVGAKKTPEGTVPPPATTTITPSATPVTE